MTGKQTKLRNRKIADKANPNANAMPSNTMRAAGRAEEGGGGGMSKAEAAGGKASAFFASSSSLSLPVEVQQSSNRYTPPASRRYRNPSKSPSPSSSSSLSSSLSGCTHHHQNPQQQQQHQRLSRSPPRHRHGRPLPSSSPVSPPHHHHHRLNNDNNNISISSSRNQCSPQHHSSDGDKEDGREREHQELLARRLARFKSELGPTEDVPVCQDAAASFLSSKRKESVDTALDIEDAQPILGTCPDMCPESEREERQRKGDLDKFERLDGNRNVTHKSLAVKKYNRVAERNAELIRPLPVLQRTIDHLRNIITCSYGEEFLSMHNFLWDRMRAIRMDLRMQHIFDKDAIRMYEQMIRFHIIAMHELCEYTKGEGFSEGFDAHLNIEQMNKTSVELFEMYDDHRRRGCPIPSEPEFRGYYALLKLDKHPGYMVEASELSLDLAKMTSEMRNTDEILFVREVARASRSGNFISFFRLARKATYLQACLMHAHFPKLRMQALASLHSGLQKNQGIPVDQVVNWLAMEDEDIESLLEYHGFTLKQFEGLYMMKDGPFLNSGNPFPIKRSQLVHHKRSAKVVDDVICSGHVSAAKRNRIHIKAPNVTENKVSVQLQFEHSKDLTVPFPKELSGVEAKNKLNGDKNKHATVHKDLPGHKQVKEKENLPFVLPIAKPISKPMVVHHQIKKELADSVLPSIENRKKETSFVPEDINKGSIPVSDDEIDTNEVRLVQDEPPLMLVNIEEVKAKAKNYNLRILLRKWKRRTREKVENREKRRLKANAALSCLLAGPPVRSSKLAITEKVNGKLTSDARSTADFSIDNILAERQKKQKKMWLRLDVPEIVTPLLLQKNPEIHCLCWKLSICSGNAYTSGSYHGYGALARRWLLKKLIGSANFDGVVSNEGTKIFTRWFPIQKEPTNSNSIFCLYILNDVELNYCSLDLKEDELSGSGGLIFLLPNALHWDHERKRLLSLVEGIQPGARIPLLIITFESTDESTLETMLELDRLDKTKICSWFSIFVGESLLNVTAEGFNDDRLRSGLLWLAEHAPLQPKVFCSETQDLVLELIGPSMKVLKSLKPSKVTASDCIDAFNKALDRTEDDIVFAAKNNLPGWPPPEVDLIDDVDAKEAVRLYLPKSGWNSDSNIMVIINALRACRLPSFPNLDLCLIPVGTQNVVAASPLEITFLDEVKSQTNILRLCLCSYLRQIMAEDDLMVAKEADTMIQKNSSFEWVNNRYLLIPEWVQLFQRIYHWRLMLLSYSPAQTACVRRPRNVPKVEIASRLSSAEQIFMSYDPILWAEPTLNEMVESLSRTIQSDLRLETFRVVDTASQRPSFTNASESKAFNFANESFKYVSSASTVKRKFTVDGFILGDNKSYTVASQTDGEAKLDELVREFCKKTDEQLRTEVTLQGIVEHGSQYKRSRATLSGRRKISEVISAETSEGQSGDPSVNGACCMDVSQSSVTKDDRLKSFDMLFQKCLAVQSCIDDRLRG